MGGHLRHIVQIHVAVAMGTSSRQLTDCIPRLLSGQTQLHAERFEEQFIVASDRLVKAGALSWRDWGLQRRLPECVISSCGVAEGPWCGFAQQDEVGAP